MSLKIRKRLSSLFTGSPLLLGSLKGGAELQLSATADATNGKSKQFILLSFEIVLLYY